MNTSDIVIFLIINYLNTIGFIYLFKLELAIMIRNFNQTINELKETIRQMADNDNDSESDIVINLIEKNNEDSEDSSTENGDIEDSEVSSLENESLDLPDHTEDLPDHSAEDLPDHSVEDLPDHSVEDLPDHTEDLPDHTVEDSKS
jgi:hypothetical protein